MRAAGVLVLVLAGSAAAHADGGLAPAKDTDASAGAPATEAPVPPPRDPHKGPFYHDGQFGVSARIALGMRGTATYHDTDYCGSTSTDTTTGYAPVCLTRAPFALEIEMAYGVSRKVDLLLEMKLGLESDFGTTPTTNDGPHTIALSPGLRYFFAEGASSKLFTTAQAVFDFTGYKTAGGTGRGADIGVRNLNGIWFDLHKAYGFYIFAGETLSVARWVDFELEVGLGIQARYP